MPASNRKDGSSRRSSRRSKSMSRMQRAEMLLDPREAVRRRGTEPHCLSSNSNSFSSGMMECRSDRTAGEMSSDLLNPRWTRLITSVSSSIEGKFRDDEVSEGSVQTLRHFIHTDATCACTQINIHHCFKGALEAMQLADKSTGFVLIGAYHYLQAEDLKLTCQTWRSLVVTSLMVAAHVLCESAERERAKVKLRNSVAHWWSAQRAEQACDVFMQREAFQREPISQQKIATLYFDLRARALKMAGYDEDSNSALAVFDCSPETPFAKGGATNQPAPVGNLTRRKKCSREASERSGASLAFSESNSKNAYNDGYASDVDSVLSI